MRREIELITVVIADGNTFLRDGVKRVLAAEGDLSVVGETGDDEEVIRIVESSSPDILLLDLEIAKRRKQILVELKRKGAPTKSLIFCSFPDQESILDTAKAGARGFLLKRATPSELIQALRKVHQGEIWVDREVNCADAFAEIARPIHASDTGRTKSEIATVLSRRELEILGLVAKGMTNAEIAKKLFVSPQTIKQHLHHIFDKLNVKNRTQAALLMRQRQREKP